MLALLVRYVLIFILTLVLTAVVDKKINFM